MRKTVNIKIGDNNPPQNFDTDIDLDIGDKVIVETANGAEWGVVDSKPRTPKGNKENNKVLRTADTNDLKLIEKLVISAKHALRIAGEKIEKYRLDMKLLSAHYTLDCNKIIVQFFSENRVDFRELVKDLAYTLRTRIELRQVGARDEAKIIDTLGPCGMQCCCSRYLDNFDNITIKMAKNQNISLNPQKITGMCGRLLCCLAYENQHYAEMQEKMPRYGTEIQTPDGRGIAQENNMIKETVNVKFQNGDICNFKCYKLCDLKCKHKCENRGADHRTNAEHDKPNSAVLNETLRP
jgi:cell fate regulator YaaT (PSP1 superfamily)